MAEHVLVVDDDDDILSLVQMVLHEEGFETHAASNGREALDLLAKRPPHLVLLDLAMPIMSGWELLARLQQDGLATVAPIVIMTASPHSAEQLRSLHVAGLLPKPFDLDELVRCVKRYLVPETVALPA